MVLLASCILLGVLGATFMRLSDGFKNVFPSVMIFVTYSASFVLFNMTLELWALSIAYAIWSGVGTALTAVVGVKLFKEKLKPIKSSAGPRLRLRAPDRQGTKPRGAARDSCLVRSQHLQGSASRLARRAEQHHEPGDVQVHA